MTTETADVAPGPTATLGTLRDALDDLNELSELTPIVAAVSLSDRLLVLPIEGINSVNDIGMLVLQVNGIAVKQRRRRPEEMQPSELVLDLVVDYSPQMPTIGHAAVFRDDQPFADGSVVISARNHLGKAFSVSVPVHFSGDPSEGDPDNAEPPRFVLRRISRSVWKIAPSILDPSIHAFVTIVGAPEPAPWEKT